MIDISGLTWIDQFLIHRLNITTHVILVGVSKYFVSKLSRACNLKINESSKTNLLCFLMIESKLYKNVDSQALAIVYVFEWLYHGIYNGGGGGWTSNQIFKKRGLDRSLTFTGGLLEKSGVQFSQRGGGGEGGFMKTNIEGGMPKKGGLDSLQIDLRGGLARKRGVVF